MMGHQHIHLQSEYSGAGLRKSIVSQRQLSVLNRDIIAGQNFRDSLKYCDKFGQDLLQVVTKDSRNAPEKALKKDVKRTFQVIRRKNEPGVLKHFSAQDREPQMHQGTVFEQQSNGHFRCEVIETE